MRVLVTGGHAEQFRTYECRMWLYAGLSFLHGHPQLGPITEIIEGDAYGFDHHAWNWALWRIACGDRIAHTQVKPDWARYGRSAGPIHNAEMVKLRPDVVLACPGGIGTANMVEVAEKSGLRVIRLEKLPVARGAPCCPERPSAPVATSA